jgi:hypothetical protein
MFWSSMLGNAKGELLRLAMIGSKSDLASLCVV